jgi:leucyl-tRNA synthetase
LRKITHQTLARVTDDIEKLHFNVCVAHIYQFANEISRVIGEIEEPEGAVLGLAPDFRWAVREAVNVLVQLFSPMMPHLAEECWAMLGH